MSISSYKTDSSLQENYTNFRCPTYYYIPQSSPMSSSLPSDKGSHTLSTRNSSGHSTPKYSSSQDETFKEGQGDPQFPSIEMQMGMIHGMNSYDSPRNFNSIIGKIRMLEDENKVAKKRNQCLYLEKEMEVEKRVKFEMRIAELEKALQEEKAKTHPEKGNCHTQNAETLTTSSKCSDEGVQVWTVCRACKRELQSLENKEPVVTMTKSELEKLEKDMTVLRDNVLSTEEALERTKKREHNYREQIARLFVEADSAQTLCKTRLEEIRTLAEALSDRQLEVKSLEKQVKDLGKLILKLNKQRNREETSELRNEFGPEVNEKEQKWIEDIQRRLYNTRNKQKTKDRAFSSQQTSPRGVKIAERGRQS